MIYLKVAKVENEKTVGYFDWHVLPRGLMFTEVTPTFWRTYANKADRYQSVEFYSKTFKSEFIRWFSPEQV